MSGQGLKKWYRQILMWLKKCWSISDLDQKKSSDENSVDNSDDILVNRNIEFSAIRTHRVDSYSGWVNSIAFSPNGKYFVSGSSDGMLRIWSMTDKYPIRIFDMHSRGVRSVAFSPDGKYIVSGGGDSEIKVLSVSDSQIMGTLRGHGESFKTFHSVDRKNRYPAHTAIERYSGVNSVAFSPDGKYIVSGSSDETIKIWSVSDGREIRTLKGHADQVQSVVFSPDGKVIASGSRKIKIWGVSDGQEIRTLSEGTVSLYKAISFSPDSKYIAAGGGSTKQIEIWSLNDGLKIKTFCNSDWVESLAFSPDGKYIASGNHDTKIVIWSVCDGREIRTLRGHSNAVTSIAYSPDGKYIVSGSEGTIVIWGSRENFKRDYPKLPDEKSKQFDAINTLQGHSKWVVSVAFSPDGKCIASGSDDGTIKIWSASDGHEIRTLQCSNYEDPFLKYFKGVPGVTSVAFSSDGLYIASGGKDGHIRIWTVSDGREIRTLLGPFDGVLSVAFSPDGKYIVSESYDDTIKIWSVSDGQEIRSFKQPEVKSVVFSPDGEYIASLNSMGYFGNIKIWSVCDGHQISTFIGNRFSNVPGVNFVAFSPDGKYIASGSYDHTIKIWSVSDGHEIKTLRGHGYFATSVAFSPDSQYLVSSGSRDKTIIIWSVSDGSEIRTLRGHLDWITSLAFSPDGKYFVSGSHDKSIKIWEFEKYL